MFVLLVWVCWFPFGWLRFVIGFVVVFDGFCISGGLGLGYFVGFVMCCGFDCGVYVCYVLGWVVGFALV